MAAKRRKKLKSETRNLRVMETRTRTWEVNPIHSSFFAPYAPFCGHDFFL